MIEIDQILVITIKLAPSMPQDVLGRIARIEQTPMGMEITIGSPWTLVQDPQNPGRAQLMAINRVNPLVKDEIVVPYGNITMYYTPAEATVSQYKTAVLGLAVPPKPSIIMPGS